MGQNMRDTFSFGAAVKRRRWMKPSMLAAVVVILAGALVFGPAKGFADTPSNVNQLALELDGNIKTDATTPPPYDWASLFTPNCPSPGVPNPTTCGTGATANSVSPFFGSDFKADWTLNADGTFNTSDTSTYATGSKDTLGIGNGGWQCSKSNNVGNKVDITNFYVTAQIDPSNGHLIAYFGLEKFGSNGTNDIGVWFLADNSADCSSTGGAKNWSGHHSDGDVLLTSEFTSGGTTSSVEAFKWSCPGATTGLECDNNGTLQTGPKVGSVVTGLESGSQCDPPATADPKLCAITNSSALTDVPWLTASAAGVDHSIPTVQFYEGAIDLTNLEGPGVCVARAVADTRSSAVPGATLFDFSSEPFAACGGINIQKYIDKDLSGSITSGDIQSGTDVAGWSFTVTDSGSKVVCSGTTNASGTLSCTNLPTGDYTVEETALSTTPATNIPLAARTAGMFNTDPGAIPNTTPATITKPVHVTAGAAVPVDFGNTCFVGGTFSVTGVPTDGSVTSVTAAYSIGAGGHHAGSSASGTVSLTNQGSGTWSGTVNGYFVQDDSVSWSWYVNGDTGHTVTGDTNASLANDGYPTCSYSKQVSFPFATLTGTKYKDANANGSKDSGEGPPTQSFTFDLKSGSTVVQTASSDANSADTAFGTYQFTNVEPGSYTVCEESKTGWKQTEPASNGCRSVTVALGQTSVTIDEFGNTPLTDIGITVTPETNPAVTHAGSISCTSVSGTQTGNSYGATGLTDGTYDCTLTIVDP